MWAAMAEYRVGTPRAAAVALVVGMSLVATLVGGLPVLANPPAPPAKPDPGPSVSGVTTLSSHFTKPVDQTTPYRPAAVAWPVDSTATVTLASPSGQSRVGAKTHVAGTPVWVQAAGAAGG